MLIIWKPEYSVGIHSIDKQHQEIVRLINELYAMLQDSHAREGLQKTFDALMEYTVFHFEYEEKLFAKTDYPRAEQHINTHRALIRRAKALKEDSAHHQPLAALKFLSFLYEWLVGHIQQTDKLYTNFLKQRGIE